MNLLTTSELKDFLRLPTNKAAKKIAKQLGVEPICFGNGRSLGNRYVREEVEEGLLTLRGGKPKSQIETKTKKPRKTSHLFDGPCPFPPKARLTDKAS
ncbi:hypothetical protein SYK_02400 [Pseudodesulfovibrio nedwellii]|uniref:Uncharacterized protein n=1 Tax=Pseudodesulfovibrio nedwellii TaxID=2973072 RepID=A0ABN6RY11_9BACT|nr:hypothetical protein [Pseudodesulfovibrio nedwellii]BDQ35880.1 hypothetical protein SYK_02400 [Pseudodesulfovibrio nedwellii]